jgi:hypothetical protein
MEKSSTPSSCCLCRHTSFFFCERVRVAVRVRVAGRVAERVRERVRVAVAVRDLDGSTMRDLEAVAEGSRERLPVPLRVLVGVRDKLAEADGSREAVADEEGVEVVDDEGVAVSELEGVPDTVGDPEALAVTDDDGVPEVLAVPDAELVWLPEPVGLGDPLAEVLDVEVPAALPEAVPVVLCEPVAEAEALAVREGVGEADWQAPVCDSGAPLPAAQLCAAAAPDAHV